MGIQQDSQNIGGKMQAEIVCLKYSVLCALYYFCKVIPLLVELTWKPKAWWDAEYLGLAWHAAGAWAGA